jgi:16S rRNA (uracil1498-N3)-methyltransferase
MTRRRWIADEVSENRAALVGEHADHLARVLRARVGQEFDIVTPQSVRRGRITSIGGNRVEFDLRENLRDEISSSAAAQITLLLAIFKFDRMEWAIEKCTELGVARIVPIIARRTDSRLADASLKRVERWQRIARQAAEQSRRISPPQVSTPVKLPQILNLEAWLKIVLSESEQKTLLRDIVTDAPDRDPSAVSLAENDVALAIGPEGGWTDEELKSFRETGWLSASLGKNVMRVETAAIAAMAIVGSALFAP